MDGYSESEMTMTSRFFLCGAEGPAAVGLGSFLGGSAAADGGEERLSGTVDVATAAAACEVDGGAAATAPRAADDDDEEATGLPNESADCLSLRVPLVLLCDVSDAPPPESTRTMPEDGGDLTLLVPAAEEGREACGLSEGAAAVAAEEDGLNGLATIVGAGCLSLAVPELNAVVFWATGFLSNIEAGAGALASEEGPTMCAELATAALSTSAFCLSACVCLSMSVSAWRRKMAGRVRGRGQPGSIQGKGWGQMLTLLLGRLDVLRRLQDALSLDTADLDGLLQERRDLLLALVVGAVLGLVLLLVRRRAAVGRRRTWLVEAREYWRLLLAVGADLEELVVGIEAAGPVVVRLELVAVAVVVARAEVQVGRVRRGAVLLRLLVVRDVELVVDLQRATESARATRRGRPRRRTSARLRLPRPAAAAWAALLAFSACCCFSTTLLQKSCRSCWSSSLAGATAASTATGSAAAASSSPASFWRVHICACAKVAAESDSFAAGSAVLVMSSSMSASV